MNDKIQRTNLSHAQFYRLCEWIKNADLTGCHTKREAARRAATGLGFDVSDSSIGNALETTGVELQAPEGAGKRRDRSVIVARALVEFMKQLGTTPPDDLVRVSRSQSID